MADSYDFTIFGAGSLSALVAGLLVHAHGKRVLRVADPVSPQRLPRGIRIALPFATRPATWSLLRHSAAETIALFSSLDAADALASTQVAVVADLPETVTALAHLTHVAEGYGVSLARVPQLTGAVSLADSTVSHLPSDGIELSFTRSGAAEIALHGEHFDAGQIVLADDAAILDYLPEAQRPGGFVVQPMTATLTVPARRLEAPIMLFPDRGVTLAQQSDLSILAWVAGGADIEARLASCLPGPFPLQRRATSHYRRLVTDGAPLIGRVKPSRLFAIAGLGDAAAFFAPPLARLLAGVPHDDEKQWFAAHDPARRREVVVDYTAPGELIA